MLFRVDLSAGRGLSEVDPSAGKWNEMSEEGRGLELLAEKWVVMSQDSLQKKISDKYIA